MDRLTRRRLWPALFLSLFFFLCSLFFEFPTLWPYSHTPIQCAWLPPLKEAKRPITRLPDARNIVVFTDGSNFDDVVALLFLSKSKLSNLVAIYVTGNGWASPGASIRHFFNLLNMMGSHYNSVPIFVGSYYALRDQIEADFDSNHMKMSYRNYIPFGPGGVLYSDVMFGMAHFLPQGKNVYDIRKTPDTDETALPALLRLLDRTKPLEKITFLSIGTMTPFALMFSKKYIADFKPLLRRVDGLFVMGGAVNVKGNIFSSKTNDKAEFNIFADPEGAKIAFSEMSKYMDITLVPLDAIKDVPITESLLSILFTQSKTPEAQFVGHMMKNLRDTWFDVDTFFQTAFLWDPSAAVAMLHPAVVTEKKRRVIRVVVEEGVRGPDQGWTKPCSPFELLGGTCAEIEVISGLDGQLLRQTLIETLQQKENSAERSLICLNS